MCRDEGRVLVEVQKFVVLLIGEVCKSVEKKKAVQNSVAIRKDETTVIKINQMSRMNSRGLTSVCTREMPQCDGGNP